MLFPAGLVREQVGDDEDENETGKERGGHLHAFPLVRGLRQQVRAADEEEGAGEEAEQVGKHAGRDRDHQRDTGTKNGRDRIRYQPAERLANAAARAEYDADR